MEMMKIKEEKANYGWYVKSIVIGLLIIGLIGLVIFIAAFSFQGLLSVVLLIFGIVLIIIFMWPAIGMIIVNTIITHKIDLDKRLMFISEMKEPKILDVGCGTGRTAIALAKNLKSGGYVIGIDIYVKLAISGNALETVQRNARIENLQDRTTFQYGSATEIPFENEMFDVVTVSSVLHEMHGRKEKEKAVREIFRVLKPTGTLYASEWNRTSWQAIGLFGIFCFVFQKYEYWLELLKKCGFKDITYEKEYGFGVFTAKK